MNYKDALDDALAATLIGSNVMMSFYKKDYRTAFKDADGTDSHEMIFTEVDEQTQKHVLAFLLKKYWPDVGMFAEEGKWRADPSRFDKEFHWQVDPIDGTKGFKEETDNFGISIGLVSKEGHSCVGVLHNPAQNLLAYACLGETAILNGVPIAPVTKDRIDPLRIIVSANQIHKPKMKRALALFPSKEILSAESNVTKAIRVFAGDADVFFGLPNVTMHSWDLVAVAAIASQSSFTLTDFSGERINLNHSESIWPKGFILGAGAAHEYTVARLGQWQDEAA